MKVAVPLSGGRGLLCTSAPPLVRKRDVTAVRQLYGGSKALLRKGNHVLSR